MARKGGSRHLKALAAPKSWLVRRKLFHFIAKPRPGPHAVEDSMPAYLILRDLLREVSSIREAKMVFKKGNVLIDGRQVKDEKRAVGFMDVIASPQWSESFRLVVDNKGRFSPIKIPVEEASIKILKVLSKFTNRGGRIGIRLHDGTSLNVAGELPVSVGDSIVISLPDRELKEIIHLKQGAHCFVFKGRSAGKAGIFAGEVASTMRRMGLIQLQLEDGSTVSTPKDYVIAIGEHAPKVRLK